MAQDAGIAFAENLVNRFMQYKMMHRQEAIENRRFELAERREQRYDKQLQENRLYRQRSEQRMFANTASLIAERGKPDRGTVEDYKGRGYSDEDSQRLADQYVGLTHKPPSAYQKITAGKMMMENPLTSEDIESGRRIMQEGMRELRGRQATFPSGKGTGDKLTEQQTQGSLPTTGIFDRLDTFESERVEIRDKQGKRFTIPRSQIDQALSEGFELIEQ